MMKKLLTLLLVLCLTLTCLVGCGSDTQTADASGTTAATEQTATKPAETQPA